MKQFLGKPIIDVYKSRFFVETPYWEAMRVVLLAHIFDHYKEKVEVEFQLRGLFAYYYRRTSVVRKLLAIVLVFLLVCKKPAWCVELGDQISADCTRGADGTVYPIFVPFFLEGTQVAVLIFSIMYFLLGFHSLKLHYSAAVVRNELIKFYLLLTLFCTALLVSILESLGALPPTETTTLLGMLFVFSYYIIVIKAMRFFIIMISYSWEVLLLWAFNIFIFALIARIAFEGVDIGAPSFLQGYSFATFADSLSSFLALINLQDFPDILVDSHAKHPISVILFVPFLLFSSILLSAAIIGNYYFHFKMCYIENLNQQYTRHPEFRQKIIPLLNEKFLDPRQANEAMSQLALKLKRDQVAGQDLPPAAEHLQATIHKVKRAVRKITLLKHLGLKTPGQSLRSLYLRVRASFAYKVVDFVLSAYAIALPLISLSRGNGLSIPDNLQASELLGAFFLADFLVYAKFTLKDSFWSPLKVTELLSSLGMVLFSHVLYLYPLDFRSDVLIGSAFFFRAWAFASLLKLFRVHKVCLNSIDYKLIIKTVLHVLPIVIQFLAIYLLFVVIFAGLAFAMLGGIYTDGLPESFKQITGNELEAVYPFNDFLGSFVSIAFMNLGGEFSDVGLPALVAFQRANGASSTNVFLTLFFYLYSIISELMIVSLIIGLTMDFFMDNGDSNSVLIKTNRSFTGNTNIIDRLLGLKTLENYNRDEHEPEYDPTQPPEPQTAAGADEAVSQASMELSKDFESVDL